MGAIPGIMQADGVSQISPMSDKKRGPSIIYLRAIGRVDATLALAIEKHLNVDKRMCCLPQARG